MTALSPTLAVPLPERAVLTIEGDDAKTFLQAQLTADVAGLPEGEWRLCGYCNPKGRLLASGPLWRTASGYAWMIAADLSEALVKRLRMFVLRAKVTVTISPFHVAGVLNPSRPLQQGARSDRPVLQADDETWLGLAAVAGQTRAFQISAQPLRAADDSDDARKQWRWLEVSAGISFIERATQELFVPQMVNLEALGGVDFKKGCYPGQEVVARSQYLGKLKRRTLLGRVRGVAALHAGEDIVSTVSAEPVGVVVDAAQTPDGAIDCLIEAPLSAWADGLAPATAPQARVEPLELPYPLPDNEVFVRPRL